MRLVTIRTVHRYTRIRFIGNGALKLWRSRAPTPGLDPVWDDRWQHRRDYLNPVDQILQYSSCKSGYDDWLRCVRTILKSVTGSICCDPWTGATGADGEGVRKRGPRGPRLVPLVLVRAQVRALERLHRRRPARVCPRPAIREARAHRARSQGLLSITQFCMYAYTVHDSQDLSFSHIANNGLNA